MTVIYEACVTSVSQARRAEQAGADRLELCARIITGGLTPPTRQMRTLRQATSLPLHVMIRPGPGTFHPDAQTLERMRAEIGAARSSGADGVVLGVLDAAGAIDLPALEILMAAARGLAVTFHRAFDLVPDPLAALETLVGLGVDRILTSGGAPSALEGGDRLRTLTRAAAERIGIIAAGGVRADHAGALILRTGVAEVHAHLTRSDDMRALAAAVRGE